MIKPLIILAKIVLYFILIFCWSNFAHAQSVDFEKAMDDIMANHISDYPDPTIKALNQLFKDTEIAALPAETQFFYHYFYAGCLADNNADAAIEHFKQARKIAYLYPEVGIRNVFALDAEMSLADLYVSKETDEYRAMAMLLYNDIITVGVSLLGNTDVGGLVVQSLIEEAKMGVEVWLDEEWVKKMWIQARDLAIEINDGTYYSYYVLSVLKYYCDQGDYDTALAFMEDAKNKEILKVDAESYCQHISDIKGLLTQNEKLIRTKGVHSLEYWSNKLDIATLSTVLCSEKKSVTFLQEVEQGLIENSFIESYEYAKVLYLLSNITFSYPEKSEIYFAKQVNVLETSPQYFIYISDTELFNALAVCQMKQGKYSAAHENYQKSLYCLERDKAYSDQPGYKGTLATVYHNLGRNHYFMGEYQESIEYLTKSITLQEETSGQIMQKTKIYMSESLNCISKN